MTLLNRRHFLRRTGKLKSPEQSPDSVQPLEPDEQTDSNQTTGVDSGSEQTAGGVGDSTFCPG